MPDSGVYGGPGRLPKLRGRGAGAKNEPQMAPSKVSQRPPLRAPATFFDFAQSCTPTSFTNASTVISGDGVRVDHILVSGSVSVQNGSAVSWPDFVRPNIGADYHPVAMHVYPPVESCCSHFRRRRVQYSRAATHDSERVKQFQDLVDNISRPSFVVEPTLHGWLLQEAVRDAAVEAFGPPPLRTAKQSDVDAYGMELIAIRRHELSRAHYAGRLMKRPAAKATSTAWARRNHVLKRRPTMEFIQPRVYQLRLRSELRAKGVAGRSC